MIREVSSSRCDGWSIIAMVHVLERVGKEEEERKRKIEQREKDSAVSFGVLNFFLVAAAINAILIAFTSYANSAFDPYDADNGSASFPGSSCLD
jgi:hypothetical protein